MRHPAPPRSRVPIPIGGGHTAAKIEVRVVPHPDHLERAAAVRGGRVSLFVGRRQRRVGEVEHNGTAARACTHELVAAGKSAGGGFVVGVISIILEDGQGCLADRWLKKRADIRRDVHRRWIPEAKSEARLTARCS